MQKPKVVISACLLGEYCRYDGKTKKIDEILDYFKDYEIIPFCPEAPIFGTPRERINVVEIDGEEQIVTQITRQNVTKLLETEIYSFIDKHKDIDHIVLKSKSPSCGIGTTPFLNEKSQIISYGDGIAAKMFKENYQNIPIHDEILIIS